ncbi:hypothetical protein [Streptomyces longispororuber]|uniref:hypothetical protein n=1 Tax=Streptomyces longispororuber TaxID=68230 RepID=UPI00167CA00B|nr:hypothetical protein [Streptomyces longispororuber]
MAKLHAPGYVQAVIRGGHRQPGRRHGHPRVRREAALERAEKLVAAANEKVRGASVRTLHVLALTRVRAGDATAAADPTSPTVPAAPVQRRAPPDGYRRAIKAHCQAVRLSRGDPPISEAVERQTAAMRELSRRAFSEPDVVADDALASIETTRALRRRQAAATEATALRRARQERTAREAGRRPPSYCATRPETNGTPDPTTGRFKRN